MISRTNRLCLHGGCFPHLLCFETKILYLLSDRTTPVIQSDNLLKTKKIVIYQNVKTTKGLGSTPRVRLHTMYKSAFILFLILHTLFSCQHRKEAPILIATAANMQFAIEPLINTFTEKTGIPCEAIISSSGKLTAQIKEGAPYAIFLSADRKYPETLYDAGLTIAVPKTYAQGQLVLWTTLKNVIPSIDLLKAKNITHIAVANPKTAPYGRAAMEVLTHYQIQDTIANKLVFGESIAQTNQFIRSQVAAIGFTAKSVVVSPRVTGIGQWVAIDTRLYKPIEQGVVLLKQEAEDMKKAQQFYDFLFSEEGQTILAANGYLKISN